MSLPKLESFTDTDGTVLETHDAGWVQHTSGVSLQLKIVSNTCKPVTGATDIYYYWNTDTPNADQYAQSVFLATTASDYSGPGVRVQTGTKKAGYWVESSTGDRAFYLDGATQLYHDTSTMSSGDVQRLEITGSTLVYKINGSSINGAGTTDTTYAAAGKLGIYQYQQSGVTGGSQDSWEGGNLSTAQDTPELRGHPAGLRGERQMQQLLAV